MSKKKKKKKIHIRARQHIRIFRLVVPNFRGFFFVNLQGVNKYSYITIKTGNNLIQGKLLRARSRVIKIEG